MKLYRKEQVHVIQKAKHNKVQSEGYNGDLRAQWWKSFTYDDIQNCYSKEKLVCLVKKVSIDTKEGFFCIYITVMQWKLAKINYLHSVDYHQLQRQDHRKYRQFKGR